MPMSCLKEENQPIYRLLEVQKRGTVTILSGARGDTRRYRSIHPYEQFKLGGIDCQLSHITDPKLPQHIARSSVIIFHRTSYDPYVELLLQVIQDRDGLAISDVDDLIFDPSAFHWISSPDFQDPVRARLYQEDMLRNRTTIEACQAVTTSTQYLAEQVQELGRSTWVHRNAFSLEMLAISEEAFQHKQSFAGKVIIGYASGTPTHDRDFEVAKPALQHILRHYPETELWLIGHLNPGKDWGPLMDRIKHYKLVPWRRLPELLAKFDINIAPLVMDNPFGQSKSEIKYVEAGLVRVPTVASPTEAFKIGIHSSENGFLASNEPEWIDTLSLLVQQAETRCSVGERAYEDVLERYHPFVRSAELINTLNQIHKHVYAEPLWESAAPERQDTRLPKHDPSTVSAWFSPTIERTPTLAQMAFYTLRHRGLRTLLMKVWIFFRRLVVPIFPYKKPGE